MSSLLTKNFDNPLPATIPIRCLLSSNKASAGPVIIDIAEKFYELLDSPSLEYDYHYEFGSCTVAFSMILPFTKCFCVCPGSIVSNLR